MAAMRPARGDQRGYLAASTNGELFGLQAELVKLQEWVRVEGARLVVIFEGRDAAGKGSAIKGSASTSTRASRGSRRCRHRPSGNARSGISSATSSICRPLARSCFSTVVGTTAQAWSGSWVSVPSGVPAVPAPVSDLRAIARRGRHRCCASTGSRSATPSRSSRFQARLDDPMRRWKLSADGPGVDRPLGGLLAGQGRDVRPHRHARAPWYDVDSDDKRRARINMIAHLLTTVPYFEVQRPPLQLPPRPASTGYRRPPPETTNYVPDYAASLPDGA